MPPPTKYWSLLDDQATLALAASKEFAAPERNQALKTHIKSQFLPVVLIAGVGLMMSGRLPAQTFKTLYSFTEGNDAGGPQSDLVLSGNTLYGRTLAGGSLSLGTVFALNTDGTGFTNMYAFTGGSDGARPGRASLILSGNTLFGTARDGGDSGYGTVFAIKTDSTGFTNLYSFTGAADGANPYSGLVLLSNTLYGTTDSGGASGNGTVFAISTDGTGFTNLYSFTSATDGANPWGGLILISNTLYGTTSGGGISSNGTVFSVNIDGTGFTNEYGFKGGSDGVSPFDGLILSGKTLYGTTVRGGNSGNGTVFKVNTNGTGFTVLHSFTAEGSHPHAGLFLRANTLYGTAGAGGSSGDGMLFAVNIDGTGFTVLHSFMGGSEGAFPDGGLISGGNALYGTTSASGAGAGTLTYGTVFSISLPVVQPQLTISPAGGDAVLTWPANALGFTLQSTTNLASPVWATNSPAPAVVNGQNVVTNPFSGSQRFFRLSQ